MLLKLQNDLKKLFKILKNWISIHIEWGIDEVFEFIGNTMNYWRCIGRTDNSCIEVNILKTVAIIARKDSEKVRTNDDYLSVFLIGRDDGLRSMLNHKLLNKGHINSWDKYFQESTFVGEKINLICLHKGYPKFDQLELNWSKVDQINKTMQNVFNQKKVNFAVLSIKVEGARVKDGWALDESDFIALRILMRANKPFSVVCSLERIMDGEDRGFSIEEVKAILTKELIDLARSEKKPLKEDIVYILENIDQEIEVLRLDILGKVKVIRDEVEEAKERKYQESLKRGHDLLVKEGYYVKRDGMEMTKSQSEELDRKIAEDTIKQEELKNQQEIKNQELETIKKRIEILRKSFPQRVRKNVDKAVELVKRNDSLMPWVSGDPVRIAIMGPWMSGKSTLINSLLGEKLIPTGLIKNIRSDPRKSTIEPIVYNLTSETVLILTQGYLNEMLSSDYDLRLNCKYVESEQGELPTEIDIANKKFIENTKNSNFDIAILVTNPMITEGFNDDQNKESVFDVSDKSVLRTLLRTKRPFIVLCNKCLDDDAKPDDIFIFERLTRAAIMDVIEEEGVTISEENFSVYALSQCKDMDIVLKMGNGESIDVVRNVIFEKLERFKQSKSVELNVNNFDMGGY